MARLVAHYLDRDRALSVIDIGSRDVNGSYRTLFDAPAWRYRGIDLESGKGVDIVLRDPYTLPLPSGSVDLVISGQAFEHIEYFWLTWLEMARVLRPGGMVFLIAPSRGPEHRFPQDCWRFYPDGFRSLAKYGRFDLLEASTDWHAHPDHWSASWGDTVGVFRRRELTLRQRVVDALTRRVLQSRAEAVR